MQTLTIGLLLALLAPQEHVTRKEHSWARFKPGTQGKYDMVISFPSKKDLNHTQTMTLKETKGNISRVSVGSETGSIDRRYAFDVPYKVTGTETIKVEDKEFKCEIRESVRRGETTKTWYCAEAPGRIVKMVLDSGGDETVTRLTKLSETVRAMDKEFDCWLWEVKSANSFVSRNTKMWLSDSIPGRIVKSHTTSQSSGVRTTVRTTVASFEIKK